MVILFGLVPIMGWVLSWDRLKFVLGTSRPITFETGLGFAVAGIALWILSQEATRFRVRAEKCWALMLGGIGALILAEYLFHWRSAAGLFVSREPMQAGFLTAVNFLLFGCAFFVSDKPMRQYIQLSEVLCIIPMLISLLALLGYAFGVGSFYRWKALLGDDGMPLETAVCFTIAGVALLCAQPERRLITMLTSPRTSGMMARRLILTPVLIPLVTGLLKTIGLRLGVYDLGIASWLFSFLNLFLLTCAIVWGASLLYSTEERLYQANTDLEQRVATRTAELSSAEAKFRRLVEQSLVGIYVIQRGRFAYVNPKMAAIFGYSDKEMTSRPLLDFIFEDDHALVEENIRKRLGGAITTIRYKLRGKRKDGAIIYLEVHGGGADFNGDAAVLGTLLDITDREHAENALRESEERYRLLVENSTELVCEVSLDGRYLYVSPNYQCLLGYTSTELLNTSVFDHIHPEDVPNLVPKFSLAQATGVYRLRDKSGAWRWLESSGRRFITSTGEQRAVIVTRDVTEKRRLEEQLLQAQKMEAIGTLAGGIAHDFNNILTALMGHTELLAYNITDEAGNRSLSEISKATRRAQDLVRRILTFSRKQDPQRIVTKLQPIVGEVASLLRASLPATINIEKQIDDDCSTVLADPTQIHQVIMNLATNAAHAMREQAGCLFFGLKSFHVDAEFAREHPPLHEGSYVRLEVTDTGCGMHSATLKRIFEPFFTTKAPGEGTGLGLSAVHGIMENHEGVVTVASEPGKGTTFSLFFPTVTPVANGELTDTELLLQGQGERILFVDDESVIVGLAEAMLRKAGYRTVAFNNAHQALTAFRSNPGHFDAIISDLTMPQMTGLDLATECQEIRPDIPIILATGYSGLADVKRANEVGIHHLLAKPFSFCTLTQMIHSALRNQGQEDSEHSKRDLVDADHLSVER